jgi:hypothetical protein
MCGRTPRIFFPRNRKRLYCYGIFGEKNRCRYTKLQTTIFQFRGKDILFTF